MRHQTYSEYYFIKEKNSILCGCSCSMSGKKAHNTVEFEELQPILYAKKFIIKI